MATEADAIMPQTEAPQPPPKDQKALLTVGWADNCSHTREVLAEGKEMLRALDYN